MISEIFDIMRIVTYNLRNENYYNNSKYNKINIVINSIKEFKNFIIGKDYKEMIWDYYEESKSLFHIQRIFPCENYMNYRKFFYEERDINVILYYLEKDGFFKKIICK